MELAFAMIFNPEIILIILLGTALGIFIGALPGLTSTMGVALAVPLTFGMEPLPGLALLGALFCGSVYGSSLSAILVNTPGTPAGAATVLDGFPMAQKGRAVDALGYALFGSFFGGVFSVMALWLAAPALAKFALRFGPPEYFSVVLFGISIISALSGKNLLKGLSAGLLGMLIATIGFDPVNGYPRFANGIMDLYGGVEIVPALIGLFSITQVLVMIKQAKLPSTVEKLLGKVPTFTDLRRQIGNFIRSSIIGTIIGILPGAGVSIAAFISYNEAMRFSPNKEEFGKGIPDGVVATETANNSVVGGAMVPLLTLGIPGDAVAAVFLGALAMQGLRPGPFLFRDQAPLMYAFFLTLLLANIAFLVLGRAGIRVFPRILTVSPTLLASTIIVLGTVGSYAIRNSFFDVWVALIFGVIGYFFRLGNVPVAPVVLGIVLGPMLEQAVQQSLLLSKGNLSIFLSRPISLAFIFLAVITFLTPIIHEQLSGRRKPRTKVIKIQ